MIRVKRVYEPASKSDGQRFLVDRLWPRGIKKEALQMAGWIKHAAPGNELRRWFDHDPAKWDEFQRRYHEELDCQPKAWQLLADAAKQGNLTLLFSARDTEHNNAVALKIYLDKKSRAGKK